MRAGPFSGVGLSRFSPTRRPVQLAGQYLDEIVRDIAKLGEIRIGPIHIFRRPDNLVSGFAHYDGTLVLEVGSHPTYGVGAMLALHELAHLRFRTFDDTPTRPSGYWRRHNAAWRREYFRLTNLAYPEAARTIKWFAGSYEDLDWSVAAAINRWYGPRKRKEHGRS